MARSVSIGNSLSSWDPIDLKEKRVIPAIGQVTIHLTVHISVISKMLFGKDLEIHGLLLVLLDLSLLRLVLQQQRHLVNTLEH